MKKVKMVWGQAHQTILDSLGDEDPAALHAWLLAIRNALGGKSPEL